MSRALSWLVAGLALLATIAATAETLLVVRKTDNALDFVDPGSGLRLASVSLGNAPHEVSVAPDGRRAVVSNYGTRDQPGSTLSIVDLEQPREVGRIDLGTHTRPHGVTWLAPDRIAVTTEGSKHLLVVEPSTGRLVSEIATGQDVSHMVAVSTDGARAYVANSGSGSVTAIDPAAGRKLADIATGKGTEAIAVAADGQEIWVGARADGQIVIVNSARSRWTPGSAARHPDPHCHGPGRQDRSSLAGRARW
jgi:YVTN family beta-propeller protein